MNIEIYDVYDLLQWAMLQTKPVLNNIDKLTINAKNK